MDTFSHQHRLRFLEAKTKEGKAWDVVLIEAGPSMNGFFYPADVLKKAAPRFEGARACAFRFGDELNHFPEGMSARVSSARLAENTVGFFENVRFGKFKRPDGSQGEGLLAKFHIFEGAEWLRKNLKSAHELGRPDILGLSIDADGAALPGEVNGRRFMVVQDITEVKSTDVVSEPAAGGAVLRLVASMGAHTMEKLLEAIKKNRPEWLKGFSDPAEGADLGAHVANILDAAAVKAKALRESVPDQLQGFLDSGREQIAAIADFARENKAEEALAAFETFADGAPEKVGLAESTPWAYNEPEEEHPPGGENNMGDQLTPDQLKEYEALKAQKAELALKEAKLRLQTRLKESGLPEKAQAQVAKVFEGQADFSDEQVDAEIASVRELVDSLKEAAPSTTRSPSGLGGSQDDEGRLQVGDEKRDRWAKAMDGFFDGGRAVDGVPAFGGLHEAYASIEGRWDNPESMADAIMGGIMMSLPRRDSDYFENHRTKLQENFKAMVPVTLKEAITTSDFPTLFGDSMFKRLQKEYTEDPRNDWRQVISSVENLRDATNPVNVPRVGGQTILPVVNQNSPYQEGTDPSEVNEQLTPAKRGRLLKLTWEDVLADNVSVLRRIPRILARSSNRTIQQVVFDEIENNPAMADAVNLIDAGHSNLVSGSPALTYSAFADAVQLLREQTEQDSGDRLGLSPWMLLVGPALEDTAIEIARSRVGKVGSTNEDQTVTNANAEWGVRAHASIALGRTGAKENHWYVMANPRDAETIVVGFLGGRDRPDIFVQGIDTPTAGSFFDADAITFKARLVVAAKVVDHRWIVGSLA